MIVTAYLTSREDVVFEIRQQICTWSVDLDQVSTRILCDFLCEEFKRFAYEFLAIFPTSIKGNCLYGLPIF